MNEAPPSPPADGPAHDRSAINRLLLFFAIVYVVEGLGQVGGLIAQPLSYYLKQEQGWNAVAGQRLPDHLQFSLDHQTGLRRLFRLRAAVRLSPQGLSDRRQYRRDRRLPLGDAALFAKPSCLGARGHGLRHGDLKHRLRRRAGGERTKARRERPLRQPAMALVQRRRHGERHRRRRVDAAAAAAVGAACRRCDRGSGAACGPVRRDFSHPRAAGAHPTFRRCAAASAPSLPRSKNASCGSWACFSFSTISAPG